MENAHKEETTHVNPSSMIDVHNLRRTFKHRDAVTDISFSVPHGTIFGLLGPNGAGKTTTIRMLTGQIAPTSGTANVAGYDVITQREYLKKYIGVVFEEQNLYERLSAHLNLVISCWLYGLPVKRVDEVLELVKLRDRAKDPVREYSNGMRQRLMIARALLHQPIVLFLDEPSRGLDPIAARDVRQMIADLRDTGMTILLTTHLMEEADQLCQQVSFMVNGKLLANDTPRNLKLAHGQRSVTVTLNDDLQSLQDVILDLDDAAAQRRLSQWMSAGTIRAMHTHEATLEEVFVAVAGIRPA
jgi:ABC-2 type transport system ATP-binding protein